MAVAVLSSVCVLTLACQLFFQSASSALESCAQDQNQHSHLVVVLCVSTQQPHSLSTTARACCNVASCTDEKLRKRAYHFQRAHTAGVFCWIP